MSTRLGAVLPVASFGRVLFDHCVMRRNLRGTKEPWVHSVSLESQPVDPKQHHFFPSTTALPPQAAIMAGKADGRVLLPSDVSSLSR